MRYPEMVKTNARRRGPRESRKQNNAIQDLGHSVVHLEGELEKNAGTMKSLQKDIMNLYNKTIPQNSRTTRMAVERIRGGELS